MLSAMAACFPPSVTWTRPAGGLLIWATVPARLDTADVLRAALVQKVAFVPGSPFFTDGSGLNTLRLNFTNSSVDVINEGIVRLGRVLTRMAG